MIYTAPCVKLAFDAGSIHYLGKWDGGWALEIETFLGPVKWHRADRRVHFGAQKSRDFQGPNPNQLLSNSFH
jgi:hypothetical protein